MALEEDADIINEAESTMQIFRNYINSMDIKNIDRGRLEQTLTNLYNEALTVE